MKVAMVVAEKERKEGWKGGEKKERRGENFQQ